MILDLLLVLTPMDPPFHQLCGVLRLTSAPAHSPCTCEEEGLLQDPLQSLRVKAIVTAREHLTLQLEVEETNAVQ